MNLDDLISKYLDGELLEYEDNELRSELSENPASKEAFDEAVIINSALREDAESITPPREFVLETEEKILMKILSSYPVSKDTVYKPEKSKTGYFAAAIIAVILFGFIRLGDNFTLTGNNTGIIAAFDSYKYGLDDEIVTYTFIAPENLGQRSNLIAKRPDKNLFITERNNSQDSKTKATLPSDDEPMLADASNANSQDSDKNKTDARITLTNNLDSGNTNSLTLSDETEYFNITSPITDYNQKQINSGSILIGIPETFNTSITRKMANGSVVFNNMSAAAPDIVITSFLGTDIMKSDGEGEKRAFNHISQSLAYSFTEDDKLGIEFGYTEYSVTDIIGGDILAQNQAAANKAVKFSKLKVQTAEGFNSSQGSPIFVREPYVYNHNKQLYWGAAFYERTFIKTSDIALNFRLGIGSSSDGALGFGKLYAKYSIISGFNITVGTEGRLFSARMSSKENKEVLRKSLSLLYGLQFVF